MKLETKIKDGAHHMDLGSRDTVLGIGTFTLSKLQGKNKN